MMMVELFRSTDLIVRSVPAVDRTRWVVTFDNYGLGRLLDRPGFGEAYMISEGISAVHVISRGNDWYQYEEMAQALEVIRAYLANAERVITYGSSMGAYAAIRFADRVRATAVLALSPQYSIDPSKASFERRWPQEATLTRWRPELDGSIICGCRPIVFYDPCDADRHHVNLIRADIDIWAMPLPYTAHPTTTFLADVGALSRIVPDLLADRLDPAWLLADLLTRRRTSAVYLSELARRQPRMRSRCAVALAREAASVSPDSSLVLNILAQRLSAVGEHDEALRIFEHVLTLSDRYIGFLMPYSQALLAAGYPERALAIADEMIAIEANPAQLLGWRGHVLWTLGRQREARRAMVAAARADPMNRHYHYTLRRYVASSSRIRVVARIKVALYDLWIIGLRLASNLRLRSAGLADRWRRPIAKLSARRSPLAQD